MPPKKNGKGKPRKVRKRSTFDKFISHIKRDFGGEWDGSKSGFRAMLIPYPQSGRLPPRLPSPKGPLKSAALSIVQNSATFNTSTGISSDTIYQSGATEVMGAIAFRLDDLDQVTTLSSLFDQYRIDRVHLRISTKNQNVNLASISSPNQAYPTMWVATDYDDATALASISELRQYPSVVTLTPGNSVDVIIEPSVTKAVYASGAFSGYTVESSEDQWIDVANTSVPHYGVKFGVAGLQASSTWSWQWSVEAWYSVSFRNVR